MTSLRTENFRVLFGRIEGSVEARLTFGMIKFLEHPKNIPISENGFPSRKKILVLNSKDGIPCTITVTSIYHRNELKDLLSTKNYWQN